MTLPRAAPATKQSRYSISKTSWQTIFKSGTFSVGLTDGVIYQATVSHNNKNKVYMYTSIAT